MPIVTWTPTRDAVAAKLPTLPGAVRAMGQDFLDRLDTTGRAYDSGLVPYDASTTPGLLAARGAWSAAYGAAWAAADVKAVAVVGGDPLPFDDMTPPAELLAKLDKAIKNVIGETYKDTLRAYRATVEAAYSQATGDAAPWAAPVVRFIRAFPGTLAEEDAYKRARMDEQALYMFHLPKHNDTDDTLRYYRERDAIRSRRSEIVDTLTRRSGMSPEALAESVGAYRSAGSSPGKLELEHTLLATMAEATEWLAIV